MRRKHDDLASEPDDENPEWTREDIRTAKPALDVIEEIFGIEAAASIRWRGGRR